MEVVDFTDTVVKHVMLNGLADPDVCRKVLRTPDLDNKSLAETLALIEAGETSVRAFVAPPEGAGVSNYKHEGCHQDTQKNKTRR
jgi:hypothetical protein